MRASQFRYFAGPPLAFAHRGGAKYAPVAGLENTLAAFDQAYALGYRHLETDVHLTRDGVLVAFHDDVLDRVTDSSGAIIDSTWAWVAAARISGKEPIPTFDDLLTTYPQAYLNVDLKSAGTPAALWSHLERHGAYQRICVGSFSTTRLWAFRRLSHGRVATSAGQLGAAALRFLPWALSRFIHTPGAAYQVPHHLPIAGRRLTVVTRQFVDRAHRLGKQVHVWTIDEPDEMRYLLDLGVDGIVTDRIDILQDILIERGHWPPAAD